MHVAFVTSEMVPYVKTGGLADVSGALPKALVKLGHRVTVVLPRYRQVPFPPGEFAGSVHVPVDAISRSAGFYRSLRDDGVEVVFVEHPPFYDRDALYGDYGDNALRFAFLSRAALEYFRSRAERPDVFHAHDWQTGLVPVYLKAFYWDDPTLYRSPCLFTIHNVAYQGIFGSDVVSSLGLPWNLGTASGLEFHGNVSFLKGGVFFSELVNTVSPTYAREIQGPEHGFGFEGVLRARVDDLVGILNGVDYDEWDPAKDRHIAKSYSAADLGGKKACKADLLRAFGLPEFPDLPVVGIISRLVWQKGFDIVAGGLVRLPAAPAPDGRAGDRRAFRAGGAAEPGAEGPRPFRHPLPLRRGPGPQDHGRVGPLPHAFAHGALRPHPDVRAALRHGARRAEHGRARGHRGAVEPGHGRGHRLPLRQPGWHGAHVGHRSGPGRPQGQEGLGAPPAQRHVARFFLGPLGAGLRRALRARPPEGLIRDETRRETPMSEKLQTFTGENWQKDVLGSDQPVLVDFWAEWCKPCLAMVPDLESVAEAYAGRLRVGKLNVEEHAQVAEQYGIQAMPTLLVFKGGKVAEQRVGKMSRDAIVKFLDPLL